MKNRIDCIYRKICFHIAESGYCNCKDKFYLAGVVNLSNVVRQLPSDEQIEELIEIINHTSTSIDYRNKKIRRVELTDKPSCDK